MKLTKDQQKKFKRLLVSFKTERDKIAKSRDKMRSIYSDMGEILDSTTEGLRDIEIGIDTLSQYV